MRQAPNRVPNRIPPHLVGIPNIEIMPWFHIRDLSETCTCGRDNQKVHCPVCGSTNIYSVISMMAVHIIAEQHVVCAGYCCRKCSAKFDEKDCIQCEAPNMQFKTMAERRDHDKAQDLVSRVYNNLPESEDRRQALAEVLKLTRPKEKANG